MTLSKPTFHRILSLDVVRGLCIVYLVFGHSAIYNFKGIGDKPLATLSPYIIAIGLIGLWAGIFLVYSLIVNILSVINKASSRRVAFRDFRPLITAGLLYIFVIGTIQTLFLGRWTLIQPGSAPPDYTVIVELIRGTHGLQIPFEKLLTGSGIKTIGLNLVIVPLVAFFLFRKRGVLDESRTYAALLLIGILLLVLSFIRIELYLPWLHLTQSGNLLFTYLASLFMADPYPGITYLSYGFFGMALGIMIYNRRLDLIKRWVTPLALVFVVVGSSSLSLHATLFTYSWFWYLKVIFETGLFLLLFVYVSKKIIKQQKITNSSARLNRPNLAVRLIIPFSRLSLTIYMLETTLSEILRPTFSVVFPDWQSSAPLCILFGLFNVLIWAVLAIYWQKAKFKYSLEYFWVILFAKLGRKSTKVSLA